MFLKTLAPLGVFLCLLALFGYAQTAPENPYLFPIKPGERNYLAGTMAELRANHFHGGLDIKTDGVEGLPVHAAADGYISRIKVSSYGYGNVLYLTHPNGHTTVYAHLQRFAEEIQVYVLKQHYALQAFEIDIQVPKDLFSWKQGDVIAYSGNSGSSGGPHLHFEIRNEAEEPINPIYFQFSELVDNLSPTVSRIAWQPLDIDTRIEGKHERLTLRVWQSGNTFRYSKPIAAKGWVGLEFEGIDRANGTYNEYGINKVALFVNDSLHYSHHLNAIPFGKNRGMHAFTHYPAWEETRDKFQRCYIADGNPLPIFERPELHGRLYIEEGKTYDIEVRLWDSHGNQSTLFCQVKGEVPPVTNRSKLQPRLTVEGNVLKLQTPQQADTAHAVFEYFFPKLPAAYTTEGGSTFLWDLRKGIPKELLVGDEAYPTHLVASVPSGGRFMLYQPKVTLEFPKEALFDTLHLQLFEEEGSLHIQNRLTPLFRPITVRWIPNIAAAERENLRVFTFNRYGRPSYVGGEWQGNTIVFKTITLGSFFLSTDDEKPQVRLINRTSRSLVFKVEDKISGIAGYRATLNGKWVLMRHDHKRDLLWLELPAEDVALQGTFQLTVTDESGNTTEYQRKL